MIHHGVFLPRKDIMIEKTSPTAITTDEKMVYYLMDEKDVTEEMRRTINQTNEILGLPSTTLVRLILNHFRWDKNTLTDKFYEDPDGLFRKLNIANPYISPSLQWDPLSPAIDPTEDPMIAAMEARNRGGNRTCRTCCAEKPANEIQELPCRHEHCLTCWEHYLQSRIGQNECGQGLLCPSRCRQIVDDEQIFRILANNETLRQRYQRYLIDTFVQANRLTKWCPGSDCNTVVKMKSYTPNCSQMVECDRCRFTYCFNCGKQWHEPVQCALLQKWEVKNQDESMTGKWLLANTKECPKCRSSIEKNGGCNHMTCRKPGCGHEFCWLCFGDWRGHQNCNVFQQGQTEAEQLSAREMLARYMHYFTRYQTHNQSLELEKQLLEKVDDRIRELEENRMSYTDRQAFPEACRILQRCRRTLKFTYAFAYYLERTSEAEIFEQNQAALEKETELLSGFFENEFEAGMGIPQKLMDKSRLCEQRRAILVQHCKDGYANNTWKGLD